LNEIGHGPLYDALIALSEVVGAPGPPGTSSYRRSFTAADLGAGGVLIVTHNLGQDWVQVTVFNNVRDIIEPDNVRSLNANQLAITLDSFNRPPSPLPGIWNLVVTA
jgi:hypothetical protein